MKIAFCSTEVVPFAKTGGMADVCGTLPLALEKIGEEVIIIMPRYKGVDLQAHGIKKLNAWAGTATVGTNIKVFFIEHEKFFGRDGVYGDKKGDYKDNLERFQFFCQKIFVLLKELDLKVDVVHCHDWPTALIPVYLKFLHHKDSFFRKTKSVFTVHNLAYQGVFPKPEFHKLGLDPKLFHISALEYYDQVNLLKGGLLFSDMVTTVSPTYAKEIQTPQFGCGLDGVLRSRSQKVAGILNGLDYDLWNPQTDPFVQFHFSAATAVAKKDNKEHLQALLHLPIREEIPLFGFVGRLTHQKGIDLIAAAVPLIADLDWQMVFLGTGEEKYVQILEQLARRYPKKIAVHPNFNEPLAHQIYAGSDIFLMPSVFEPCGLSQMISLRYGTIPLVYRTGGLADTIAPVKEGGNGFVFAQYTPEALGRAVRQAIQYYHHPKNFAALVKRAFTYDFSWGNSAEQYAAMYRKLVKE